MPIYPPLRTVLFRGLKWISSSDIVKSHQLSLVFKCINRIAPVYLQDMFYQKLCIEILHH